MVTSRLLKLDLDYELRIDERMNARGETNPYHNVTRNLIDVAFQLNYEKMDQQTARLWRALRRQLDHSIEDGHDCVILSAYEFDALDKEIKGCNYPPGNALLATYLCDELDAVKARTNEQEAKVQDDQRALEQIAGRSSGVTAITKAV